MRKKAFPRTSLEIPLVASTPASDGVLQTTAKMIAPIEMVLRPAVLPKQARRREFDFSKWYGTLIDPITAACQSQIARYLATHDGDLTPATINNHFVAIRHFLTFCAVKATSQGIRLGLSAIDRNLIDEYLAFLRSTGTSTNSQRTWYSHTKPVLRALGKRGLIKLVSHGDDATFPKCPYNAAERKYKGETAFSKTERKAFTAAVKTSVMPILTDDAVPSSEMLSCALLIVALHTGRTTTPLMELSINCLRPHPKEGVKLLVTTKRRAHKTDKIPVRKTDETENMHPLQPGVVRLIERVILLTAPLRVDAPDELKDRLWIERPRSGSTAGSVIPLPYCSLQSTIRKIVETYGLKDAQGNPLRINISRLRKTFGNRIFDILSGDLLATARAMGNTPKVADEHYMAPDRESQKKWLFMGRILSEELLGGDIRTAEKTPTGRCSDTKQGQFAPKSGATCMNFLACLRCRNYVVTGDDLYRLFSFYWLIVSERGRVDKRKWKRSYAHLLRLIDRDVVEAGIRKKAFTALKAKLERERAKLTPHPFWANPEILGAIS